MLKSVLGARSGDQSSPRATRFSPTRSLAEMPRISGRTCRSAWNRTSLLGPLATNFIWNSAS